MGTLPSGPWLVVPWFSHRFLVVHELPFTASYITNWIPLYIEDLSICGRRPLHKAWRQTPWPASDGITVSVLICRSVAFSLLSLPLFLRPSPCILFLYTSSPFYDETRFFQLVWRMTLPKVTCHFVRFSHVCLGRNNSDPLCMYIYFPPQGEHAYITFCVCIFYFYFFYLFFFWDDPSKFCCVALPCVAQITVSPCMVNG